MDMNDLLKVIQHLDQLGFSKRNFGKKPKVKLSKEALISKIEAHLTEHKLHWNYAKGIAKQMFQKEALELLKNTCGTWEIKEGNIYFQNKADEAEYQKLIEKLQKLA